MKNRILETLSKDISDTEKADLILILRRYLNFVVKSSLKHNGKYNYSKSEYTNGKTKVCIICPEHGEFWQIPDNHFRKGYGCPECGKIEKGVNKTATYVKKKFEGLVQPEEYKLIPLGNNKYTKVDNEDYEKLKDISWSEDLYGYAVNQKRGRLHRFIMNPPKEMYIDHINHNTLDNRKKNLRVVTRQQNAFNMRPQKDKTSKYKGVCWSKRHNKYSAQIKHNKVKIHIGYFDCEYEASIARDLKALELQRDFAYLNHPEKKEEYLKILNDKR